MKPETIFDYYIVNHELVSCKNNKIFDDVKKDAVYEVIKLINGIPLFFEEHMDRFRQSGKQLGIDIPAADAEIADDIRQLSNANHQDHNNVKLVFTMVAGKPFLLIYFIQSFYPGPEVYSNGVHTILFKGERDTPNIKTVKGSFRGRVKAARQTNNAYEALLVNSEGFITEGSRSNIFFIKGKEIFTPPSGAVLMGITRAHVMKACQKTDTVIHERCIHQNEIADMSGVFITGTTVDVLPVSSINEISMESSSNPIIRDIIQAFKEEIETYFKKHPSYQPKTG